MQAGEQVIALWTEERSKTSVDALELYARCTRLARGVASGAAEQYRRGGVAGQLPGEVSAEKALIDQSVVDIAQALNS